MPNRITCGHCAKTCCGALVLLAMQASATTFDVTADWSDTANPNGAWSYLEGSNPLPHVSAWQEMLGGWAIPQPAWSESQDGNNRLPMWFKSNGSETFPHDFLAGDVVLHTLDPVNGTGNGEGSVAWKAPGPGTVTITGGVWMGRDIGRSNNWTLYHNATSLRSGSIASGDAFSRATPFAYSAGAGGGSLVSRPVACSDTIRLELVRTSVSGDFVGVNLTIDFTPSPCTGDLNGDGARDTLDLVILLGKFGASGAAANCADVNGDHTINTVDLTLLLGQFGAGCP